jgi:hypothetical protein
MLPTLLLYGYYGAVLGEVVALNNAHRTADPAHYAMLAVGLAATLTVTVIVSRIAQRELRLSGDASLTSQRIV